MTFNLLCYVQDLSMNQLARLEGLEIGLSRLETLAVYGNKLTVLEGLHNLPSLRYPI